MCQWKCGHCGKFSKIADTYVPFGNSEMLEPPDEVPLCQACSDRLEADIIKRYTHRTRYIHHWCPAQAELRAMKTLGMVRAGPKGAAWSQAFKPDAVPSDYEIWKETN